MQSPSSNTNTPLKSSPSSPQSSPPVTPPLSQKNYESHITYAPKKTIRRVEIDVDQRVCKQLFQTNNF